MTGSDNKVAAQKYMVQLKYDDSSAILCLIIVTRVPGQSQARQYVDFILNLRGQKGAHDTAVGSVWISGT